ncbi:MAG: PspC domain-containing protein [Anaerolineae bacterium]|nr:PspC domain-containing protein [Anaerolineae bacterium]MCO5194034.1 PspC domain-containing protein [Anaerolineae bacterium]
MANRLVRSDSNKMIAGVCGGLGVYLGIDPTIVRIAFIVLTLASGIGFALYIVLAIVMPGAASAETPSGKTIERNIEDLGENIVKSVNQLEDSRGGPILVAGLLIAAGVFFLLGNLGIHLNLGLIVSIGLIGVGAWLVFRNRSR